MPPAMGDQYDLYDFKTVFLAYSTRVPSAGDYNASFFYNSADGLFLPASV